MKPALLGGMPPFNRLLFFVLLMIASFGAVFLIGIVLAGPLFGLSFSQIPALLSDYENPESIGLLKYFQILQSIGLFIIPPLLAGIFFERNPACFLALNTSPRIYTYLLVFLTLVLMTPFVNGMITWNEGLNLPDSLAGMEEWMQRMEEEAGKLTEAFMHVETAGGFLLNILMIAVLPAFGEEFLFRGVLQRLLGEWTRNMHVAILVSALAFGIMHMQFYGLLPRVVLGIVFGYMFLWTGSLWIPIFAHFLNNASALVLEQLVVSGQTTRELGSFGDDSPVLILVSLILTAGAMFVIFRTRMKGRKNEGMPE